MNHSLQPREIEKIIIAAEGFPEIEEMILFGSRAKGKFKKASDIDLAIKGNEITESTVKRFSSRLNEEVPLPYFFDVIDYKSISNKDLVEHIDRVGNLIYKKQHD
ncbi:MAG: nucleotidyltransferase domain-containing protein [Deltaproteobacteria bacterium]|nr:nucleotidyltransferase domain-containing protein [Deltaproteobacteria bacterium]